VHTGFWWGRHEGKEPLGRTRRGWDNIKMDQEVGLGGRDRWWALVNAVMNFRVPQNAGSFLTRLEPVSFSGRTLLRGVC
jgi:hypothetical protein